MPTMPYTTSTAENSSEKGIASIYWGKHLADNLWIWYLKLYIKKFAGQNFYSFLGLPWNMLGAHAVVTADVVAADLGSTSMDLRQGPTTEWSSKISRRGSPGRWALRSISILIHALPITAQICQSLNAVKKWWHLVKTYLFPSRT